MLSIAVCDDEILDCCHMAKDVKAACERIGKPFILREFHSGEALLQAAEHFDIILLDIIMDGRDGMETARLLRERGFDKLILFISSSREFVFEGYDVEAFAYLVKPVEAKKLDAVLLRAAEKLEQRESASLIIRRDRESRKLLLQDICYFEIRGRVITVHSTGGTFDYYGQIGALEKELSGKGFFRCHKSFLVHLLHVDTYNRREAMLDNGERIMIAERRYEAFCKAFLAYVRQEGGIL